MTREEFQALMRIRRSFGDVDAHCQLTAEAFAELAEDMRGRGYALDAEGWISVVSCNGVTRIFDPRRDGT
jgi:DNA-binding IclR family transcriptional regulator